MPAASERRSLPQGSMAIVSTHRPQASPRRGKVNPLRRGSEFAVGRSATIELELLRRHLEADQDLIELPVAELLQGDNLRQLLGERRPGRAAFEAAHNGRTAGR